MRIIFILIVLLFTAESAYAEWEKKDTYRQLAITALFVADRNQTRRIASRPDKQEDNIFLGKNPSPRKVDQYFLASYAVYSLAYCYLPKYRTTIFSSVLIIEVVAVSNNISGGLSINF